MAQNRYIAVSTDPLSYNIVLRAIKELNEQGRLKVINSQHFNHHGIKNDKIEENKFKRELDFCNTASSVMRMAFLHCAYVPQAGIWAGPWHRFINNQDNVTGRFQQVDVDPVDLEGQPVPYVLAIDKITAKSIWSRYDQLFPHYRIEEALPAIGGQTGTLHGSLFIFRNNFTEVIEVNSTLEIKRPEDEVYDVNIAINLLRRKILGTRDEDKVWMKILVAGITDQPLPRIEEVPAPPPPPAADGTDKDVDEVTQGVDNL